MKGYIKQFRSSVDCVRWLKSHGVNIQRLRLEPTTKSHLGSVIVWFTSNQSYNLPTFKA